MSSVRRVVTGLSPGGKAIVTHDGPASNAKYRQASGIYSTLLWTTDETSADNARQDDGADRECGTARRSPEPSSGSSTFHRPRKSRKPFRARRS